MPQATKAMLRKDDDRILIKTTNYVRHTSTRRAAWKSQFAMTRHEASVLRDELNTLLGDSNETTTE